LRQQQTHSEKEGIPAMRKQQASYIFLFVILLLALSLIVVSCGTSPELKLDVARAEAPVGEEVAIIASVEPLENLNLKWKVEGTAEGTLNTYQGEHVVYTATKPGTAIVTAIGNTASGVPVQKTVTITITGNPIAQTTAVSTPTQMPASTIEPAPTAIATAVPTSPQTVGPTVQSQTALPTINPSGNIVPATIKGSSIAIFRNEPKKFFKRAEEDAIVKIIDRGNFLAYQFTYNLPTDETFQHYHAGFAFYATDKPQDFSIYEYVYVTITLGDEQAKCEIFLREDDAHNPQYVPLDSPPGEIIEDSGQTRTIRIPLSEFGRIDLTNVRQFGFNTNTDYTRSKHSFTIDSIGFSKKQ
jgi:hypothetical protein